MPGRRPLISTHLALNCAIFHAELRLKAPSLLFHLHLYTLLITVNHIVQAIEPAEGFAPTQFIIRTSIS